MASTGTNNLADQASFHQNTTGYVRHMNLDSSNAFYTDPVNGLSVQSIAESGDDISVTFDAGDDLSKVMKFSKMILVNTTNGVNNGTFEVISANNTTKVVLLKKPVGYSFTAQAGAGGDGDVVPLQGANYMKATSGGTTFTSLVEHTDFISGDEDFFQGATWDKGDFEFGYFTEIVPSAGSVRIAIL